MGSCRIRLQTVGLASVLLLAGCEKLTGDEPKIVGDTAPVAETTPAPAPTATSTPTPGSGWNEVAHETFASPAGQPNAIAALTADAFTSAPATPATAATPAGPAPDVPTAPDPAFADSPSLYLRQAQKSAVNWRSWGQKAFAEAEGRQVPVLIVIGTAWSHDARMMDEKVFADPEISELLNKDYVTIRVDADSHPDIWARYRLTYEMLNKQRAHLPLTVFALPDGRPFDVVSSMPARSEGDTVGMLQTLNQASQIIKDKKADVTKQANSIESVLGKLLTEPRSQSITLSPELLESYSKELAGLASGENSEGIRAGRVAQSLMVHGVAAGSSSARSAASSLLLSRFKSGQRDQVLGGYFFRVPGDGAIQYGKLLPIQAEMITANAEAYATGASSLHKEAVTEVLRFCRDWLEAPEGGFFSGQAPDTKGDDSGGYFTWSQKEIESIIGAGPEAKVFSIYLNVDPDKKSNMHVTGRLQPAADAAGLSYEDANKALATVRKKLSEARMAQEDVPMVDKSILSGWNGDMICAYLDAAKYTSDDAAKEFALKSADRIIDNMISEKEGVAHVMYKGKASGYGYLEDNVKVAAGLLKCYEATNQQEYLDGAISLMGYVDARFQDKDSGLYQDVLLPPGNQLGLLKLKRLPLEDDLARSSNAVAAIVWLKLAAATGRDEYKEKASRMIKAAIERRSLTTEALATWGQAADMLQYGIPEFKK